MAEPDVLIARSAVTDSNSPEFDLRRRKSAVAGYAKQLSHPAYERLLKSEDLLRKLVPILIVIFLVIIATARWVQINNMGKQIIAANKAELHFIAELAEVKIENSDLVSETEINGNALRNLLADIVPARYISGIDNYY